MRGVKEPAGRRSSVEDAVGREILPCRECAGRCRCDYQPVKNQRRTPCAPGDDAPGDELAQAHPGRLSRYPHPCPYRRCDESSQPSVPCVEGRRQNHARPQGFRPLFHVSARGARGRYACGDGSQSLDVLSWLSCSIDCYDGSLRGCSSRTTTSRLPQRSAAESATLARSEHLVSRRCRSARGRDRPRRGGEARPRGECSSGTGSGVVDNHAGWLKTSTRVTSPMPSHSIS